MVTASTKAAPIGSAIAAVMSRAASSPVRITDLRVSDLIRLARALDALGGIILAGTAYLVIAAVVSLPFPRLRSSRPVGTVPRQPRAAARQPSHARTTDQGRGTGDGDGHEGR
jgi:hypothetical protein